MLNEPNDSQKLPRPQDSSVEFREVSFSYDGQKMALTNLSFRLAPGQKIALSGSSGSGKRTLASLIAGQLDPQKGEVLVGGIDVRQIDKNELTNFVSLVFQNNRLADASLLDNVRQGRSQASAQEVREALKVAQGHELIYKLPDGLDTVIGDKGFHLSEAEQQRLAIADSVIRKAGIIIFDEATAFPEEKDEANALAAFSELSKQSTVIMIARRVSTIISADHVLLLDEGRLVENDADHKLEGPDGLLAKMRNDSQTSLEWKKRYIWN
jgi:ATP-binding cassette subfamily B protein